MSLAEIESSVHSPRSPDRPFLRLRVARRPRQGPQHHL